MMLLAWLILRGLFFQALPFPGPGMTTTAQTIAHLDHNYAGATSANGTATTAAMACSGASFIQVFVATNGTTSANATVTDSGSHSYTTAVDATNGNSHLGYSYAVGAGIGAAGMTVSASCPVGACGANGFTSIIASCWSGTATTTPIRATSSANGSAVTSLATGNVTTAAGDLLLTAIATDSTTDNLAAPTGYTATGGGPLVGSQHEGQFGAYKLSPANPENPTWAGLNNGTQYATWGISVKAGP